MFVILDLDYINTFEKGLVIPFNYTLVQRKLIYLQRIILSLGKGKIIIQILIIIIGVQIPILFLPMLWYPKDKGSFRKATDEAMEYYNKC